jgi:hypothetical protein
VIKEELFRGAFADYDASLAGAPSPRGREAFLAARSYAAALAEERARSAELRAQVAPAAAAVGNGLGRGLGLRAKGGGKRRKRGLGCAGPGRGVVFACRFGTCRPTLGRYRADAAARR